MTFDSENTPHLKPWLVRTLEPICDAEPGALAEYILALLKHNVPENEMRKELAVQLDEFLEKECQPFIDTLFTVLRTKSYLPYTVSASSSSQPQKSLDSGIPIPLDSLLPPSVPAPTHRSRKRSLDDDGSSRAPVKGPRLSGDGNFARYGNGRGSAERVSVSWNNGDPMMNSYADPSQPLRNGMPYMADNRRPQAYQPPDMKRGICRDYHNNGYCSRGALCKFSHGDEAVMPGQMFPMNGHMSGGGGGMPFMPMFNQFGAQNGNGSAYDPREARMDMRGPNHGRPNMRPAFLPRAEDGVQVVHTSGELPVIQDLTPSVPHNDVTPNPHPSQPPTSEFELPRPAHFNDVNMASHVHMLNSFITPGDVDMAPPNGNFYPPQSRGGRPSAGRGRGTFGDVPSMRPERRRDKTLVVEKIPADKLSLEHVNDWFKRFGTVTNVAIDKGQAKALVSFSEHDEAHTAWKSEDAVFNNRFVKVFWHRPMEGQGQIGTKLLAASAPLVANMTVKEPVPQTSRSIPTPSTPSRKASSQLFSSAVAIAAKQKQLEQQIVEQKKLMSSLSTANAEEKKSIMARLKELTSKPSTPTISPSPTPAPPSSADGDEAQKKKDILDKELELHSAAVPSEAESESAEDLKAKLERLKEEAASLGIPDAESGYPRPFRGRGRGGGRGYFRGAMRGGPPRASMKLDNRPKQLLVRGITSDQVPSLTEWYESMGQMESLTSLPSGEVVVSFKTRAAAEQAVSKGTSIPLVGTVQLSWHSGATPTPKQTKSPLPDVPSVPTTTSAKAPVAAPVAPQESNNEIKHGAEDDSEVIASGWGGDADDGMMGMF